MFHSAKMPVEENKRTRYLATIPVYLQAGDLAQGYSIKPMDLRALNAVAADVLLMK
jgi:hypothetical protein